MKNFFKNLKTPYTVKIQPIKKSFEITNNQTLLQAAIEEGVSFPYHCKVGTCGTCKCKLLEGNVQPILDFSYTLTQSEISEGYILACQSKLKSNVVIELEYADENTVHPIESYSGIIKNTRLLTHDIMEVSVELNKPIKFTAGQFANITLNEFKQSRSYSFACAPDKNGTRNLVFHIRKVSGGKYTEWLFEKNRINCEFNLEGPTGSFWLRTDDSPILCIAGGSGMAPIKAILEDAFNKRINRPVTYLFGARTQNDLYCLDEMMNLKRNWPNEFNFIPVLSEELENSTWEGNRGWVTNFITNQSIGFELLNCTSYLCGPPVMIDAAIDQLEKTGVKTKNIHYDKFLDSQQLEAT